MSFFKELEAVIKKLTAADERKYGVAQMSQFLSVCNLIKQMKEWVPEGANILSESTAIHSFGPLNMHKMATQYCTGQINLKHTIQRRQLSTFHTNSHYCYALYRYLRELAVQN